jgi:hypothetical protein
MSGTSPNLGTALRTTGPRKGIGGPRRGAGAQGLGVGGVSSSLRHALKHQLRTGTDKGNPTV